MAAEERAERLRAIQAKAHQDVGWVFTPYEVNDLVKQYVPQCGFPCSSAPYNWRMTAEQLALISTDPTVMHGQAVIAGTRVPVSVILDCLADGMSVQEIVEEYPTVTAAGARAAAAYGAVLAREELVPLTPGE